MRETNFQLVTLVNACLYTPHQGVQRVGIWQGFVQTKPIGLAVEDVCKWQVGFVYNSTAEQRVQSEKSPLLPRVLLYLFLYDQTRVVKSVNR